MKSYDEKVKEIYEGKNLEEYLHDENEYVRAAVARYGYGLDILINDDNPVVREAVAFKEYGLNILVNDSDNEVRHTAFTVLHSVERNDVIMNYEDTIRLLNGLNIEEKKGSFQKYIVNLNTCMEYSYGGHDYNVLVANVLQQIMDIIQYQLDDENTLKIYYDESYIFIPNYTNKMIKLEYFVKWFKEEKK